MIDISPFPYQGPLEADEVRGREQLVTDLVERVSERRVTALLGPRRYGKTSVLRRVAADVGAGGVSVVWLDLYEVTSMADLAMRLDAALADAVGSFAQRATTTASGLGINLGVLKVELRRSARSRPEPVATTHALLEILVRSATNGPTVVIFDEFSSIGQVRGAAGLLRTALQHHYRTVGLMFAGSRPSMMRTLFSSRSEPFYGQADLLDIGPLPTPALADIVSAGFEETGRSAGGLPARIAAYTGGHPQRAMQLADAAWRRTPAGTTASVDVWDMALAAVRKQTAAGLERLFSGFSGGEKAVLRVVAGGGALFGSEGELLALATGTAQHARQRLVQSGDLVGEGANVRLVDPVFADWIRWRFPL